MARGVRINNSYFPVISFSANVNRNPLIEESFSSAAATKVFGGAYSVSGSFEAIYRTASSIYMTKLIDIINNGVLSETDKAGVDIILEDDHGNLITYKKCFINSCEMSLSSKDFVRLSYSFIGTAAKNEGSTGTPPAYENEVGIFYSTVLNSGLKATSASIRFEVPIDQDYFVLGSEYIQSFVQSGLAVVEGNIALGPDQFDLLNEMLNTGEGTINYDPDISHKNAVSALALEIKIGSSAGGTLRTITVPVTKLITGDISTSGRNKFERSISFMGEFNNPSDKIMY